MGDRAVARYWYEKINSAFAGKLEAIQIEESESNLVNKDDDDGGDDESGDNDPFSDVALNKLSRIMFQAREDQTKNFAKLFRIRSYEDFKSRNIWIEPPFQCDYGYMIKFLSDTDTNGESTTVPSQRNASRDVFINFNCVFL